MNKVIMMLAAVIVLTLAACSSAPASSKYQQVQVETTEFKYQPATIQVEAGKPVKLTLLNKGSIEHDFSVVEILVVDVKTTTDSHGHDMSDMAIQPKLHVSAVAGKSSVIEFTPTRPGTYEIICTVAGHKEAGMVAKLIVN